MYGYIYKTTNLINNKIYIGQRKSDKYLGTKYLGSGTKLKEAINQYGRENFIVELIQECEDKKSLDVAERYWVKELNTRDPNIGYNIAKGGNGGYGKGMPKGHKPTFTRKRTKEELDHFSKMMKENYNCSEETKLNISKAHTGARIMNNGVDQKYICVPQIEEYLSNGWVFGSCKKRNRDYSLTKDKINNKNRKFVYKIIDENNYETKFIPGEELDKYLNHGWIKGVKPKHLIKTKGYKQC